MKNNAIRGKMSDSTIKRTKKKWGVNPQPGSNGQRFRFKLFTLDQLGVNYPDSWK
jgi:hypothetical protein